MVEPTNEFKKFQQETCPDISCDDPNIIYRLLEELKKRKKRK